MRRIVHLIPYDGIGGVERAAASSEGAGRGDLRLERMFIFEDVRDRSGRGATFNPRAFWVAAGRLARAKPDMVVLSLWRAVIVGGLARLRGCDAPMVLFLHNAQDAHALDRHVTRMAATRVREIWADSATTLDQRLPLPKNMPTRIISYLLARPAPVRNAHPDPTPNLIYWGRLAAQKNPLRMIALFAQLHAANPAARLTVIGPDGGLEQTLREDIKKRGLDGIVTLTGPLTPDAIADHAAGASFYIQTSHYEGMALSVMEAMQAGLVPVVTPVGEVARYSSDPENAIWIEQNGDAQRDQAVVARISNLLRDPDTWRAMRSAGLQALDDRPFYVDDVMDASARLLASEEHAT